MKKIFFIVFLITSISLCSQTNSSFFDGKSFQLEYFLKDGVREDLDLLNPNDPSGNTSRGIPKIKFSKNTETNELDTEIYGYCNGTSAKYLAYDTYLEVLERGGTTLSDCGGDEETEYFTPITGNIYLQQPPKKVNYEFTEDEKGLWLWSDENHKLFFSEAVLSIEENELEKAVAIFPNPAKNSLNIEIKSTSIQISDVSILDFQGRIIIQKIADFNKIDISKLASGVYFVKIKSKNNTSITKKLVKK